MLLAALEESNLDAILCTSPPNVLMTSGYWPVIGNSISVFTKENVLALLVPEDEFHLAANHGDVVRAFAAASLQHPRTPEKAIADPLKELLSDVALQGAKIGVAIGSQLIPGGYVSVHVFGNELSDIIGRALPNAVLISCDELFASLRSMLTEEETKKLRAACRIAGSVFEDAPDLIQTGISEVELAAELSKKLATAVGCHDVQRAGGSIWCMSGANSARAYAAFQMSTGRRLQDGDLVLVHCNSYADGFWTDITRTYIVGENEKGTKILGAIREASVAAANSIRDGVCAADVDGAAREVMVRHGLGKEFKHGLGHGVGFVAIDHEAKPRLTPNSPDLIQAGMAFNIEPGAYFDGWGGARRCDMVRCATSGVEILTDF